MPAPNRGVRNVPASRPVEPRRLDGPAFRRHLRTAAASGGPGGRAAERRPARAPSPDRSRARPAAAGTAAPTSPRLPVRAPPQPSPRRAHPRHLATRRTSAGAPRIAPDLRTGTAPGRGRAAEAGNQRRMPPDPMPAIHSDRTTAARAARPAGRTRRRRATVQSRTRRTDAGTRRRALARTSADASARCRHARYVMRRGSIGDSDTEPSAARDTRYARAPSRDVMTSASSFPTK